MLDIIIPFLILLIVVVFVHEYGHYYFAKKYGVGLQISQLVSERNYSDGMINLEQDGNFA